MLVGPTVAPLLRVALLDGLTPLQITELARSAEKVIFRDRDVIVREGDCGSAGIVIVRGQAQRTWALQREREPELIDAGSLIGELSMLIGEYEYGSTIIASGPVRALRITHGALRAQMESDPLLCDHFVNKIAGRLSDVIFELHRIDAGLAAASCPGRMSG